MTRYNTKPALNSKHYDACVEAMPSLEGKSVAVTGTTTGIGFVAAYTLARSGARVLLLNRASERVAASHAALSAMCPAGVFVDVVCDLQSFDSVKAAAASLEALCPEGLDVLCNNAGVMALSDRATAEGFDVQMQTNHLSHFLLTKRLFPSLKRASEQRGEARIVNHTSIARLASKRLEAKYLERRGGDLGGDANTLFPVLGGRWKRYSQSKLANCVFTSCLHEMLKVPHPAIKAFVAHPGLSTTDLADSSIKDGGMVGRVTGPMIGLFYKRGQSAEDGATSILRCMSDEALSSGVLVGPGKGSSALRGPARVFSLDSFYDNDATRELLWSKSCEAIGEDFIIA